MGSVPGAGAGADIPGTDPMRGQSPALPVLCAAWAGGLTNRSTRPTRKPDDPKIEVRVMHPVQRPECRYRMEHDVLQPDAKVHDDHRNGDSDPELHLKVVEQTPSGSYAMGGETGRGQWKQQPQENAVEQDDSKVARPAHRL